jgi:O-antigen ligase/polysaccharide polymerase Wzy-like membrane protein
MPEHIRALMVILVLASGVFALAKAPACAVAMEPADFARRRNLWFAVTLVAFLAHNFWVFIIAAVVLLLFVVPREPNKLALYFFILFAIPPVTKEISGLGGIRYFFDMDYLRLLSLAVLLPAFISLRRQPDVEPFGRMLPDKLLAAYLGLNLLLMLPVSTFTGTLRNGVFYAFIDVFLPYYVASRSVRSIQAFRDVLMAFAVGALILSAVAAFEFAKHWLLYSSLEQALGAGWGYGKYLGRGDESTLRALGSTGHPIPLGYVITVAIGFLLYLQRVVPNRLAWTLGLLLLGMGLIAPLSRGPWVGAATMLLMFTVLIPSLRMRFAMLALIIAAISPLFLDSSLGDNIIEYLPFVGHIEEGNVTYRKRLLEVSVEVILQNPFFGASDYIYSPAIQELRQGQGIIDVVNSYLAVGLGSGLVGLSLFVGFMMAVAIGAFKRMNAIHDRDSEHYRVGAALISAFTAILLMITAVSSISVIPVIYWCAAGLCVSYARLVAVQVSDSLPKQLQLAHT